jgi:hypothetical protein
VNYLRDLGAMGPGYVDFLESLNYNEQAENSQRSSYFDNIADELYKKIVQQGYVEKPSKVSRKTKKGDSDVNYYNSGDNWIDDEEGYIEKKEQSSTFEDYSCLAVSSLEELYASPVYTKRLEALIVEAGKRRAP